MTYDGATFFNVTKPKATNQTALNGRALNIAFFDNYLATISQP